MGSDNDNERDADEARGENTLPFVQNKFIAWNSREVEVFLEHCVNADGILGTSW